MHLKLRLFSQSDGIRFISKWVIDPDYATFWRNNSVLPTLEECVNYPGWSQNVVMMVDLIHDLPDENASITTIGMVTGYHVCHKNGYISAGIILNKEYQGQGLGHNAQTLWIDYLFKRMGFRKVIVENLKEHFTEPYLKTGFFVEGNYIKHSKDKDVIGKYNDEVRMACFAEDWKGVVK
jgi:RimJ/RimL family protein N-acetyltransferase